MRRGDFREVRGCAGIFAGSGETLDHACYQKEQSGGESDGSVTGEEADHGCRQRHHRDRYRQGLNSSVFVTKVSPHNSAERADEEGERKECER